MTMRTALAGYDLLKVAIGETWKSCSDVTAPTTPCTVYQTGSNFKRHANLGRWHSTHRCVLYGLLRTLPHVGEAGIALTLNQLFPILSACRRPNGLAAGYLPLALGVDPAGRK